MWGEGGGLPCSFREELEKNWRRIVLGYRTIAKVLFRNGGAFVAASTGVSSDAFAAAPLAAPLPGAATSAAR